MNPIFHDEEGLDYLAELALDMYWYWNHSADEVWQQLDPVLWKLTYNPWVVLQTISREQLRNILGDPVFCEKIRSLLRTKRESEKSTTWFQRHHADSPLTSVAYFSMEFMLSEALPIYSGGLGNVAGDQLKTSSDLGVPVIGIGLLYQQGYFRQIIDKNGSQQALFPYNDPGQLPISPLREPNGEWLRLKIKLPGYSVWLRTWQVQVGRVKLFLLDSNDPANFPTRRGITSELYGGGDELRLQQELVLGLGGWRLLKALGVNPEVCHLNEGHAAFVVLERTRTFMEETGQPFDVAMAITRTGNLFTTHTPVDAGFDRFPPDLIKQYLGGYAQNRLGISLHNLLALGHMDSNDSSEPFNMAYLALRGSEAVNGVSRLHGKVSRRIFQGLFPRWPEDEVPIGHITNGVHVSSWDSEEADALWTSACGKERWMGALDTVEGDIHAVSDSRLWECRSSARQSLIEYVRERYSLQMEASGFSGQQVEEARHILDFNALTLGFGRRFASYKRPNLLLHDPKRLLRILNDRTFPVQLIIAGKAHPADQVGQALIQEWTHFAKRLEANNHVIFLSDYDMFLTGQLVQGVDVWINTPHRPWEACGTSGMKVLVNGGLNLSELDGWWDEAYTPEVGWAIGDGKEHGNDSEWDATEANMLYTVIEDEVIPEFYQRNQDGIPTSWVSRIRESMARLTPRFSANRTVREYTEKYYIPLARAYKDRSAANGSMGEKIVRWQQAIKQNWSHLRFGEIRIKTTERKYLFEIQAYLNSLDPDSVSVELYADGVEGGVAFRLQMRRSRKLIGTENGFIYTAEVEADRPASDFTARLIPSYPGAAVPLESNQILWQR